MVVMLVEFSCRDLCCQGFSETALCGVMKSLQLMIRQKCDIDRCVITVSIPARYQQYTLLSSSLLLLLLLLLL